MVTCTPVVESAGPNSPGSSSHGARRIPRSGRDGEAVTAERTPTARSGLVATTTASPPPAYGWPACQRSTTDIDHPAKRALATNAAVICCEPGESSLKTVARWTPMDARKVLYAAATALGSGSGVASWARAQVYRADSVGGSTCSKR